MQTCYTDVLTAYAALDALAALANHFEPQTPCNNIKNLISR